MFCALILNITIIMGRTWAQFLLKKTGPNLGPSPTLSWPKLVFGQSYMPTMVNWTRPKLTRVQPFCFFILFFFSRNRSTEHFYNLHFTRQISRENESNSVVSPSSRNPQADISATFDANSDILSLLGIIAEMVRKSSFLFWFQCIS